MAKVFICGGVGFIGSHLSRQFCDEGHEVVVYDFNIQYFYPMSDQNIKNMEYRHNFLLKDAHLIRGSTLDVNDLRRQLNKHKPDYLINLSALPIATTAVQNSEEAFDSILTCTKNIMEILRDVEYVKKYIHISSSMIYGDFIENPNPETAPKNPKEIYGSMKLASEYIVKGYAQRHNVNYAIIRPSAVYGPTDNNKRVLQKFIENAINETSSTANNPASNFLDFTFVEDTAQGIMKVTLSDLATNEEFNITRGEGRSLKEAIEIIKNIFPRMKIEIKEDDGFYPKRGALDISKAIKLAGYKPRFSLEDGIKKYIDFLK